MQSFISLSAEGDASERGRLFAESEGIKGAHDACATSERNQTGRALPRPYSGCPGSSNLNSACAALESVGDPVASCR